jgi:tRNA (guanine-N7-)-methyltransferase
MSTNSKQVSSTQQDCHPRLDETVRKHLASENLRPPAIHTRNAFDQHYELAEHYPGGLVFDSFCGTGMSTARLAGAHPDCLVIGIDKSGHRLARHQAGGSDNYRLAKADCGDFWRLALAAGWRLQHHYLLYPNPWPKPGHLQRRVHGSPELANLLALGGTVELRTNWHIYAREFSQALAIAGYTPELAQLTPAEPISLFESKYLDSGHQLWRCWCKLSDNEGHE